MSNKVCDLTLKTCNPQIRDLEAGTIFRYATGDEKNIFMKLENGALVLLRSGGYYSNPTMNAEAVVYAGVSITREK